MSLTPAEQALAESMYAMFSRQIAPPLSPSPLPTQPDTDSQTLKGGGDSIYVNSITGDGS